MATTPDKETEPCLDQSRKSSISYTELVENDIRIVSLLPGLKDDEIRCEVSVEDRTSAANTYDAVSYCWGDPSDLTTIVADNETSFITVSLADALRTVRHPDKARRLWVDSISINQADGTEKTHQVKMMGEIYENAISVLVWLGHDEQGHAEDCFNLIRETNKFMDGQWETCNGWQKIPRFQKPYPICTDRSRWDKVRCLMQSPWFTRVWVIQESGLAKRCFVMWGEHKLDFSQLVELGFWECHRADMTSITGPLGLDQVAIVFRDIQCTYTNPDTWRMSMPAIRVSTEYFQAKTPLFLDIMDASVTKHATDARDHIYAFLGHPLAHKVNGDLIVEPEYDKDVDAVYFEVACALLEHPREGPYVLSRILFNTVRDFDERIGPSWAPRWARGRYHYALASPTYWYSAGGSNVPCNVKVEHRDDERALLHVQGFLFEVVNWVSPAIDQRNLSLKLDEWEETHKQAEQPFVETLWRAALEAVGCTAEHDHEREEAFSMTLVRGYPMNDPPEGKDRAAHKLNYAAYLRNIRSAFHGQRLPRQAEAVPDAEDVAAVVELSSAERSSEVSHESNGEGDHHDYQEHSFGAHGRRFACTKAGHFGLVPPCTEVSDVCCLVPGMSTPLILRPTGTGHYHILGDCYIHGVMQGELMTELANGNFQQQTFTLV